MPMQHPHRSTAQRPPHRPRLRAHGRRPLAWTQPHTPAQKTHKNQPQTPIQPAFAAIKNDVYHGHYSHHGFTAIELMVTLAILGVLSALAAPSFVPLLENWRVRQATDHLQNTLYFARAEAMKRGGQVVIQKIPNNTNGCTSASSNRDWDCGWTVCYDDNNNGSCNTTDPVLQRIDMPRGVQVTRTGGAASIKFNRWGLVAGAYLGFNIVPLDKNISHPGARGLCMSSGGRIRVVLAEDIPCNA